MLEHHISEELEELIAAKLGQPARDPHGDPIPSRELDIEADRTVALSELEVGADGVFERVSDRDPEMLRYLDSRGIRPGAGIRVTGREPFEGPISVRVGGAEHALGAPLARRMRVSVCLGSGLTNSDWITDAIWLAMIRARLISVRDQGRSCLQ